MEKPKLSSYEGLEYNITSLEISAILKGVLFVQEMHEESRIDAFVDKWPEKYKFLKAFGVTDEEVIFQGSTAEGLAIYEIDEKQDPSIYYGHLRWFRRFDYDIMYVSSKEIIDDWDNTQELCSFMNSKGSKTEEERKEEWTEAKFCKHEEEPFVVMRIKDRKEMKTEHVGLVQPVCDKCFEESAERNSFGKKQYLDFEGRKMVIVSPYKVIIDFMSKVYQNSHPEDENCDSTFDPFFAGNHNRYGDMCNSCQAHNSFIVTHEDGARSEIFMDKVTNEGPSISCRFYMKNIGDKLPKLPLFNEPDVSTVDVDNIPAFKYPKNSMINKEWRWPYDCLDFFNRKRNSGWPSVTLRDKVLEEGCHLVPKIARVAGDKAPASWSRNARRAVFSTPTWRISFSVSEKILTGAFSQPQRKCFLLVKMLLKFTSRKLNKSMEDQFGEDKFQPFVVSSFLLKHIMFWTLEEVPQVEWRLNNLYKCILHLLKRFKSFLIQGSVPHYFFGPEKNLLACDMSDDGEDDKHELESKINILKKGVVYLMKKQNIFEILQTNFFDYQWNEESSLYNDELCKPFGDITQCACVIFKDPVSKYIPGFQKEWKISLAHHHKAMIDHILYGTRRYGSGVNTELLEFLEKEKKLLDEDKSTLEDLDYMEKYELVKRLVDERKRDKAVPIEIQLLRESFNEVFRSMPKQVKEEGFQIIKRENLPGVPNKTSQPIREILAFFPKSQSEEVAPTS